MFQIVNGPQVVIEAKANVTMPDMQISSDVLQFNDVKCGECRVITVQLHNHQHVRCDWNSQSTDRDRKKVHISLNNMTTIQLHNHQHVRCDWNSQSTDRDRKKVCVSKQYNHHPATQPPTRAL